MSQYLNTEIQFTGKEDKSIKSEELEEILEKLRSFKGYNTLHNFSKEQEIFLKTLPKKYIEVLYKRMSNTDLNRKNIKLDSDIENNSIEEIQSVSENDSIANKDELSHENLNYEKNYDNNEKSLKSIRSQKSRNSMISLNFSNFLKNISPQNNMQNNIKQSNINKYLVQMSNSKKPLWIEDVKKTCDEFIPQVDMKDLENTKDILIKEEQEEIFLNHEDYPYFQTVKKLMYAFGDVYKNNSRTVLYLHDFLKKFLILLCKIINECEFKKVLEHLYSYEFHKFFNYKKLKFKNNFGEAIEGEDCLINSPIEGELDIEDKKKQSNVKNTDRINTTDRIPAYSAFELGDAIHIEELAEINNFQKENFEILNEKINHEDSYRVNNLNGNDIENEKNYLENIFEEKDENYFENLEFQDQRTSTMNHSEYLEFISCRHQTFLTKGKKSFLNFLQNILQNNFAFELRDSNNLELISFLMKEILRKVVTNSIKNKFPGDKKKLFILNFPLTVQDLEEFCNNEFEKLEIFLSDFYTDIYLIKEFKKKKFSKKNNKNVKIKRNRDEFVIVIKKLIYLDDDKQIEFLRKEKKNSEEKVMNVFQKKISETYNEIKKKLKSKFERPAENNNINKVLNNFSSNSKTRANSKKSQNLKNPKNSEISDEDQNFTFPDLNSDLALTNFYEYFLIKDYLIDNLYNRINDSILSNDLSGYKLLIDEMNKKSNLLKKLNRKTISNKFSQWLRLSSNERNYLIEEFQNKNLNKTYTQNLYNKITNSNSNKNSVTEHPKSVQNIFENSENFSSDSQ